jgi:hypothetical protein
MWLVADVSVNSVTAKTLQCIYESRMIFTIEDDHVPKLYYQVDPYDGEVGCLLCGRSCIHRYSRHILYLKVKLKLSECNM